MNNQSIMTMKRVHSLKACMVMILFLGCDGLGERPPHLLTTETLYTTYEGFQNGLNGLYSEVRLELTGLLEASSPAYDMTMTGTDVMYVNLITGGGFAWSLMASRYGDPLNPTNIWISAWFSWIYRVINAANAIIIQAERDDVDWSGGGANAEETKNLVIAEARGVRAWAYRHLTYLWGDVPLRLEESTGSTIKTDWVRTPVEEVRRQIIDDLLFAEQHIPSEASLAGRMTKGAVQHYLAEMYLALDGNYPPATENVGEALFWANQVINNPAYALITGRYGVRSDELGVPFMDMFYDGNSNREEGNSEALWVFQYERNVVGGSEAHRRRNHATRYSEIVIDGVAPLQITFARGGRGSSISSLTNFVLNLWEDGDDRGSEHAIRWFYILKDAAENAPYGADRLPPGFAYGDTIWNVFEDADVLAPTGARNQRRPYARKVDGTDPFNVTITGQWNDQVYLRLAETYLIKAEAQYLLGDLAGASETLNVIRRRSNASDVTPGDVDLDFILDERARELVVEEHRRYTLLRTGTWMDRTRAYNFAGQFITERDKLIPIPQDVIDANLAGGFAQNPGY